MEKPSTGELVQDTLTTLWYLSGLSSLVMSKVNSDTMNETTILYRE